MYPYSIHLGLKVIWAVVKIPCSEIYIKQPIGLLGSIFLFTPRGVTQLGLVNPLVGARIALAWR